MRSAADGCSDMTVRLSHQDERILRDRQASASDAFDQTRAGADSIANERQLVKVYNAGAMVARGDYYFACHPAAVGCAEVEASPCTPVVDTSTTILVDFLRNAPSVGDYAIAVAVGGRWVAEVGGTPASDTICVTACSGLPVGGASVTIQATSTGPILFSGTTDSGGCVALTGIAPGSYYVTITTNGSVVYAYQRTIASGTNTIALGSSGFVCCGGYAIPQVLTLTDADGSLNFEYDSVDGLTTPTWYGGHAVTRMSSTITTPNNICTVTSPTDGPVRVCYMMTCNAGSSPVFQLTRSWSFVDGSTGAVWYQDTTGFTPGRYCITAPPPECGNPNTDTATGASNPSSTSPFAISFAMSDATTNATSDPIGSGDTVAISS